MASELSDAGRALAYLAEQLDAAEADVMARMAEVLRGQEALRRAITNRDAIDRTLGMTARFMAREAK